MGKSIVGLVIDALLAESFRAAAASPAGYMPAISIPALAVGLEKADLAEQTVTVRVSVLVPESMGSAGCEAEAIQVGSVLRNMGAACVLEGSRYDGKSGLFRAAVLGTFRGRELDTGFEAAAEFSVTVAGTQLSSPVSFISWQELGDSVGTLSNMPWYFRLEELIPLDVQEEEAVLEPFAIRVSHNGKAEIYQGCTLTAQEISVGQTGVRKIREGVAGNRIG